MAKPIKTSGIISYYNTQKKIFELESNKMTTVFPHLGERGANDEERLKAFLLKVLPKRYGISSGFIVNSNENSEPSNQIDVIIYDHLFNSPLFKELHSQVFPIESVFATIEVKRSLYKGKRGKLTDLEIILESNAKVREMSKEKEYVCFNAVNLHPDDSSRKKMVQQFFSIPLPPRSFVFAYASRGWKKIEDLCQDLNSKLKGNARSHLHGIVVLDQSWFLYQKIYSEEDNKFVAFTDNCLLRFTNTLLRGIQSMPMYTVAMDKYHLAGFCNEDNEYDPVCSGYSGDTEPFFNFDSDEVV